MRVMAEHTVNIDLGKQVSQGDRKLALAVGIIGFLFFGYQLLFQQLGLNFFLCILFVVASFQSILIGLKIDPLGMIGRSYIKLNTRKLVIKRSSLHRPISFDWGQVKAVSMESTDLGLTFSDGERKCIKLDCLTPKNIKYMKRLISTIKVYRSIP